MIKTVSTAALVVGLAVAGGLGLSHAHTRSAFAPEAVTTAPAHDLAAPAAVSAALTAPDAPQAAPTPKRTPLAPKLVVQTPGDPVDTAPAPGRTEVAALNDAAVNALLRPLAVPVATEEAEAPLAAPKASKQATTARLPAPIVGTSNAAPDFKATTGTTPRRSFARAENSENITPRYLMGVFR